MIKYRFIYTPAILFLLGILIWYIVMQFTNTADLFSSIEINHKTNTTALVKTFTINELVTSTDNNSGSYETIDETINRIKQDVIVTGTVTGTPGQESALFQIEGMPDRSFQINKQLMDGFIITEITENQVVLKNQAGDETFFLRIQAGNL